MSNNPIGAILSIIVTVGFLAVIILLGFVKIEIPVSNRDFFNMGFGALISMTTAGYLYWLGSSKGSADKTAASDLKDSTISNLTGGVNLLPPKP